MATTLIDSEVNTTIRILGDPTRCRILQSIRDSPKGLNVLAIQDAVDMDQSSISHHLARLRDGGLVTFKRDGKHSVYSVIPDRLNDVIKAVGNLIPRK